jgi:hypothetical protein
MRKTLAALGGLLVLSSSLAGAATIKGEYIEARTADVYTGPCFSNAEVFLTGHQAVVAWSVREGSWDGVDLAGLTVAAAIRGTTTFSEDRPGEAQAVLIVDERATPRQREALVAFARSLAGDRLRNVVDVKTTRMSLMVEADHTDTGTHDLHKMPSAPKGQFWAAGLAEILTRPLDDSDHACGNEVVAYPPLSKGVTVLPAYTLGHKFRGAGLNTTWDDPNCRSAFVGHFAY